MSADSDSAIIQGQLTLLRNTSNNNNLKRWFSLHKDFVLYSFMSSKDDRALTATEVSQNHAAGPDPATTPPANVTTTSYYTFGGRMIGFAVDGVLTTTSVGHLGSTELTNTSGALQRQTYLPFGGIRSSGANVLDTDRTYTGQVDDGIGWMHYRARQYDPLLGRFMQADTVVADGLNRYAYVRNNPLGRIDPTGFNSTDGPVRGPHTPCRLTPEGCGGPRKGDTDVPDKTTPNPWDTPGTEVPGGREVVLPGVYTFGDGPIVFPLPEPDISFGEVVTPASRASKSAEVFLLALATFLFGGDGSAPGPGAAVPDDRVLVTHFTTVANYYQILEDAEIRPGDREGTYGLGIYVSLVNPRSIGSEGERLAVSNALLFNEPRDEPSDRTDAFVTIAVEAKLVTPTEDPYIFVIHAEHLPTGSLPLVPGGTPPLPGTGVALDGGVWQGDGYGTFIGLW